MGIIDCPNCPKSCPEMKKSSRKEEYRDTFPIWGKIWAIWAIWAN